jgi:hypothetical protein
MIWVSDTVLVPVAVSVRTPYRPVNAADVFAAAAAAPALVRVPTWVATSSLTDTVPPKTSALRRVVDSASMTAAVPPGSGPVGATSANGAPLAARSGPAASASGKSVPVATPTVVAVGKNVSATPAAVPYRSSPTSGVAVASAAAAGPPSA